MELLVIEKVGVKERKNLNEDFFFLRRSSNIQILIELKKDGMGELVRDAVLMSKDLITDFDLNEREKVGFCYGPVFLLGRGREKPNRFSYFCNRKTKQ